MGDVAIDTLTGALAKLGWAQSRLDAMLAAWSAFLAESDEGTPYVLEFDSIPKPAGRVVVWFNAEREMPDEVSLLAADLVHNTRAALDHTLAGLKARFGGDAGSGSFPICKTSNDWASRVDGKGRSPLAGLEWSAAFDLIERHQPLATDSPEDHPLVVLHGLDNDDKHRLLRRAFAYPKDVEQGTDFIVVHNPGAVRMETNVWQHGQPLPNRTRLAEYLIRGEPREALGRKKVSLGFAIGEPGAGRTDFEEMIAAVTVIVDHAMRLVVADP